MSKLITLFAVLGMVLALAPAAQAELVITVTENGGNVDFAWNGIIGASGTATAPTGNGSADQIIPLDGTLQVGDRSTNDLNPDSNPPFGNKKWTPSGVYAGTTSPFGTGAGTSTFVVTGNIPFFVKSSNGGLLVGYTDQATKTGIPDLSSTVFTGSFSLPGTTLATFGLFDTGPTALPTTLWTATTGGGSIVFKAPAPAVPTVTLDGNLSVGSAASNAPPGTQVGALTMIDVATLAASHTFSFAAGAGDTDNGKFDILNTNELRANQYLPNGTYAIRIEGDDGDAPANTVENTFTITASAGTYSAFVAEAGVTAGIPAGGEVVATLEARDSDGSSITSFAIIAGRDDLFQIGGVGGNELQQKAGADPGAPATTHYVTLFADGVEDDFVIVAIEVGATPGTVIRFR